MRRQIYGPAFDLLDETAAAGGRMFAQVQSGVVEFAVFESYTPYDNWEYWSDIAQSPLVERGETA